MGFATWSKNPWESGGSVFEKKKMMWFIWKQIFHKSVINFGSQARVFLETNALHST